MTTIYLKEGVELPARDRTDHYATPRNLITATLEAVPAHHRFTSALDIGAGDGRWGQEVLQQFPKVNIMAGVEITDQPKPEGFTLWCPHVDFLTWEPPCMFNLIVSNPPYYIAEEIIRKAWTLLEPGGEMIMLLRLAFQASIARYKGLWKELYPIEIMVCSRRPSFYGGGTNGTDYGVFVWHKQSNGTPLGHPLSWRTRLLNYEKDLE